MARYGIFKVEGLDKIQDGLDKLGESVGKQIVEDATKEGAKVMAAAVKGATPRSNLNKRYHLQDAITYWKGKKGWIKTKAGALISYSVGGRGRGGRHLHLVEEGTQPHPIQVGKMKVTSVTRLGSIFEIGFKKSTALPIQTPGGLIFRKKAMPHSKPHPFMGPAFSVYKERIAEKVTKEMASNIEKSFKRLCE